MNDVTIIIIIAVISLSQYLVDNSECTVLYMINKNLHIKLQK